MRNENLIKNSGPSFKEVLRQNPSYQISKHHPSLCPKGCPSSFPRQIEKRQVCDYNVIQHS